MRVVADTDCGGGVRGQWIQDAHHKSSFRLPSPPSSPLCSLPQVQTTLSYLPLAKKMSRKWITHFHTVLLTQLHQAWKCWTSGFIYRHCMNKRASSFGPFRSNMEGLRFCNWEDPRKWLLGKKMCRGSGLRWRSGSCHHWAQNEWKVWLSLDPGYTSLRDSHFYWKNGEDQLRHLWK